MLRVENLRKTFLAPDGANAVPVVDVAHFQLAAGDQMALVGTSGSGKTTFLHLLAGILAPDTADAPASPLGPSKILYRIDDRQTDLARLDEPARDHFRGQHIGYIFQTHHLLPGLTALENVLLGMSFTGRRADHPWALNLLTRVGLADRLHYKPGKLSVGQQQRVAVARALANRPALVLADEPTGSLDAARAQSTLDLIRELCTDVRAALILVTHDAHIAAQLPRRVELAALNRAATAPAPINPTP